MAHYLGNFNESGPNLNTSLALYTAVVEHNMTCHTERLGTRLEERNRIIIELAGILMTTGPLWIRCETQLHFRLRRFILVEDRVRMSRASLAYWTRQDRGSRIVRLWIRRQRMVAVWTNTTQGFDDWIMGIRLETIIDLALDDTRNGTFPSTQTL